MPVTALARVGAVRPIGLLHPGDDAAHVVLPHAPFGRLRDARPERERAQLQRPELVDGGRHRLAVEHEVPPEEQVPRLPGERVAHFDALQERDELARRQRHDVLLQALHVGHENVFFWLRTSWTRS